MKTSTAQLPPYEDSDDKVLTTENAVIVLDGASAFRPVPVPASLYAHTLGRSLQRALSGDLAADLRETLADAISTTAQALELSTGDSPTSTVAIVRRLHDQVEVLVLGDSPVILPDAVISDDRIDELDLPERSTYRSRLASGTGYDEAHRTLLKDLQAKQLEYRNRSDGYWIAETDPIAAHHALVSSHRLDEAPWCVLATDGAANVLDHLNLMPWSTLATKNSDELDALLQQCRTWEAVNDPDGKELPRAKRHDDKTLAVVDWQA